MTPEKFSLSRIMRPSDYSALKPQLELVDLCQSFVQPPHWGQHTHRRWEQALALRAMTEWGCSVGYSTMADWGWNSGYSTISDWGCCCGLLPAICVAGGARVDCYEPWAWGDERPFFHRQIEQVLNGLKKPAGHYALHTKPLCELDEQYYNRYDVSFCISTIEHIGEWEKAFRQLCNTVRDGGLLLLTFDYSGDAKPDCQFASANVRPNGMPRRETLSKFAQWGSEMGFEYFNGEPDWDRWTPECVMVADHGFASLAMLRTVRDR